MLTRILIIFCRILLESSDHELSNGMYNSDRTKTEEIVCIDHTILRVWITQIVRL